MADNQATAPAPRPGVNVEGHRQVARAIATAGKFRRGEQVHAYTTFCWTDTAQVGQIIAVCGRFAHLAVGAGPVAQVATGDVTCASCKELAP